MVYIGDTSDDSCCEELCNGVIRTVVSGDGECSEQLHSILIDSGADASIFPASLLGLGKPAEGVIGKLCDAQGVEIPVDAVQDMEIRLRARHPSQGTCGNFRQGQPTDPVLWPLVTVCLGHQWKSASLSPRLSWSAYPS